MLCLLDGGSKIVLKKQHAATLQQWRVGGGVSKHQLLLEFRGAKWQLIGENYFFLKVIFVFSSFIQHSQIDFDDFVGNYAESRVNTRPKIF